ncbi:MAG: toll/interleukin-1 receptor domain-containing protein [Planctomycetes bacterium]|nr:toll/interleukin-1 receptor domain-containing protein [Planctomycetota bacterium]
MSPSHDPQIDVFVSYAHVDNEASGWVEQFERQLDVRLRRITGRRDINVWQDTKQLRRSQNFGPAIEEALAGSRFLVVLVSATYLKSSPYCTKEREFFLASAKAQPQGLSVGTFSRIIVVLTQNIPHEEWSKVLPGTSGHAFHNVPPGEDRIGDYLKPDSEDYDKAMGTLAEELSEALELFAGNAGAPPAEAAFEVFLSHAADDMEALARSLERDLEREGVRVLPHAPPPFEPAEHATSVAAAVQRADLTVHLLGKGSGAQIEVDGDPLKTFPLEQLRIGFEHARSQLVLQPQEIVIGRIEDPADRDFLTQLEEREREPKRFEIVRTDKHRMLDEILAKKAEIEEARRQEVVEQGTLTALVDLYSKDLGNAAPMVDYLNRRSIRPMLSAAEPSMQEFTERFLQSQLFIIVFGEASRDWVRARLEAATKLIWDHELERKIAVYAAPPQKEKKDLSFKPFDVHVAVNVDGFDPQTLEPLLS